MNTWMKLGRSLLVCALCAGSARAQIDFQWTNSIGGVWSDSANWVNEWNFPFAPNAGGFNDYMIEFQNAGSISATNDDGVPNFLLNQLVLNAGAGGVTLFAGVGANLVFTNNSIAAPPAFINNSTNGATLNGGMVLASATIFDGAGPGTVLVNSNITGTGALWMNGAYRLVLAGANTYASSVVSNGTLQIGAGLNAGSVAGTITTVDGGSVAFYRNDSPTIANNIAGNGTLVLLGTGISGQSSYTLTGANTETGPILLTNSARLSVGSQGALGNTAMIVATNGGEVYITGGAFTNAITIAGLGWQESTGLLGAMRLQNGTWNGPITLAGDARITSWSGNGVINGMISGNYALAFTNDTAARNITISNGSNTYSGGTTIGTGNLVLGGSNVLGTGSLLINGGWLSNSVNAALANPVVLAATANIGVLKNTSLTLSGPITGSGGLTMPAGSAGRLILSGANNFAGNVTLNNCGGFLVIQNSLALGLNKTVLIQGNAPGQTLVMDGSSGDLTLDSSLAFQTSWSDGSGAISNAAGNNVINGNFTLTTGGGATRLVVGAGTLTFNGNFAPNTTLRQLTLDGAGTGIINGVVSDGGGVNTMGGFVKTGSGLWIIGGNNNFFGTTNGPGTVISNGTLQVGNGAAAGTLGTASVQIASGTLAFNRSDIFMVSNVIYGAGSVVYNGSGYGTFNARTNTYTGGTIVNNGTLGFASVGAVPVVAGGISNTLGGAVAAAGAYTNVMGWLASGRIATDSLGALALVSDSAETVDFSGVYSNLSLGAAAGLAPVYSGAYTPVANSYGAQNYNFGGGGGTLVYLAPLSNGNVTIQGPGLVQLAGTNTFSGGLTVMGGEVGVLRDSGWGAAGNVITLAGGALAVDGLAIQNLGVHALDANNLNGGVDVTSPYGAFVIATNIDANSSLTKLGKGYLLLTGTNTYTGGTIISNGTLRLLAGGGNNLLSTNSALTVVDGTLDLAGSSQATTNAVSFQGGVVQGGSLTAPMAMLDARAGLVGVDLNLTGSEPLVKTGSGLLTLLGNNTYSGGTVLSNGQLAVVSDANIGGASSTITFAGGGLTILGSALANLDSHTVNWSTLPAGTVLDIATAGNVFTVTNSIGGSSLIKDGAGTLALTGNNNFTDALTVRAGALNINDDAALGVVPAVPIASLVFSGNSVLQAGAPTVTLTNNRSLLINGGVMLTVDDEGGVFTINGALTGAGGLTKVDLGTVVLAGANAYSGATVAGGGTLTFAGSGTNSLGAVTVNGGTAGAALNVNAPIYVYNNNIQVGTVAGDRSTLNIANNLMTFYTANTSGKIFIGNAAGASGAVIQNAGTTSVNTAQGGTDILDVGNNSGYGYYQMNGGVLNAGQLGITGAGGSGSIGIFEQNGGTVSVSAGGGWLLFWGANNTGVLNIANGTMISPNNANAFTMSYSAGKNFDVVNVLSNGVLNTIGNGSPALEMMRSANTGIGDYLNINSGGLVMASKIQASATGTTWLSFNGGTLQAKGGLNQMAFLQGLSNVVIYAGGATMDSSNSTIGIAQNLLAPTGSGVTDIALTGGGAGYIGAPAVIISGGGGVGATAIAQFDYVTGTVTNILITSAGYGYTYLPTVTLAGGGALTPATLGAVTTNAVPGGALTKQGPGTLILSGTNSYTGGSLINDGVLAFASTSAIPATPAAGGIVINTGGALAAAGAFATANAWLTSSNININSTGALALGPASAAEDIDFTTAAGGLYSNLFVGTLAPLIYTGTLGFYNNDYRLGGGGSVLAITNNLSGNTLTVGQLGTSATNIVQLGGTLTFGGGITVNSNAVLSLVAPTAAALTFNNAALQVRGTVLNSLTLNPAIAGNVMFDINNPGNSFTIATNLTVGGTLAKTGSGTLVLSGANNLGGPVVVWGGALNVQNNSALDGAAAGLLVTSNNAALQLQGGTTVGAGNVLTLNGGGVAAAAVAGNGLLGFDGALRNISGSNTWAGTVTLGSAARINSDGDLLTLSGLVNNNNLALTIGGAGNTLVTGVIAGTGSLTKDGAGTLVLAGSNIYSGVTYLNGGQLALDFSIAGAPANNIVNPASTPTFYPGSYGSLVVIGSAAGVNTQTFNNLTANSGSMGYIAVSNNGYATVLKLNIIPTNSGSIIDFTLPALGSITVNNALMNGIIPTATIDGQDFATTVGGTGTALTNYTGYTLASAFGDVIPNNNASNVKIDASSGGTVSITNATLINSLLVNDPGAAHTIALNGNQLKPNSGGPSVIMLARGSADLTIGSTVNDGSLAGGNWLYLINNSLGGTATVNAAINNGGSYVTVGGPGDIELNGTNFSTGNFYVNGPGAVAFNNASTLSAVYLGGGTVTFGTNSALTITNVLAINGNTTLNVNGPVTIPGSGSLQIGQGSINPNQRTVVNIASDITVGGTGGRIYMGFNSLNDAVAINQTAGTVISYGSPMTIGDGTTYVNYRLTGGMLAASNEYDVAYNGVTVVDVLGGTLVSSNGAAVISRGNGGNSTIGILNVNGGTNTMAGAGTGGLQLNLTANAHSYAVVNLLNGLVDTVNGSTNRTLNLMVAAGNQAGIFNLNGGTLRANQIRAGAIGPSIFNFNGGTLAVSPTSSLTATFMQGLSAAYVFGGGATIDTDTGVVTIAQSLLAPTGQGLASIALMNQGGGYIGNPAVVISGGSGTGATAIAQVDLGSGALTNILVTSAGSGYLPDDAITVQLVGGGFTSAAVVGAFGFVPNTSSGLTKLGAGTLTLTGSNTFGGTSTINEGMLQFQPSAVTTNTIGGLGGAGAMQHNGTGMTILNGDSSTFTGSAAINTGTVQFANLAAVPVNSNVLVNSAGTVALDFGGGNVQAALNSGIDKTSTGVIALTPNSAGESVNFNTAGLTAAYLGAAGTMLYDLAQYTPAVAGTWRLGGGGGTLVITNGISAGDALVIGGVSGSVQAGGAYSLSSLTVNSGALFNIGGNNQTLGALSGGAGVILNTNSAALLTVGGAGSSTIFGGSINGAIGLTKVGNGTLTLTNCNVYDGATLVSAGTLQLAPTGPNQAGLTESWTNVPSVWAPNGLTQISTALYPRYAETNTGSGYNTVTPIWPANFPSNATVGYSGYVYNNSDSNVTWTFAANIDDGSQLVIDGVNYLTSAGNATAMTTITLTPGAHTIDYRLQNGTGGAGSYGIFGSGSKGLGLGYDPLGRGLAVYGNFIIPMDTGNGTFFTTGLNILPAQAVVQIASGATLDLNGAQQLIAGLSDPFTAAGLGGFVTNSQTATTAALTLSPQAGSNYLFTGNINDAGAANAITITVNGPGIQTFAGTNTYGGGTLINSGGILQINNTNAVPQANWVTIGSNGALAAGSSVAINDLLRLGRITNSSAGSVALTGDSGANVDFTLGGGYSNLYLGAIADATFSGTLTPPDGVRRFGGGGAVLTVSQPVPDGSVMIGGGAGTVMLGNSGNTYTGTVINAGALRVGADGALGNIVAGTTNITFTGAGALQAGAADVILDAARTILVTNGVYGALDNNGYNFTINGNILGSGTLASMGAGTNTLGGLANTVLGIQVRSGTLAFAPGSSNYIAGFNNNASYGLQVAPVAGDRAVVLFNPTAGATNVVLGSLRVGNATNAAGAVYQTGGLVWQNGLTANQAFSIGSGGGYGYYNITGGTVMGSQMEISGINAGAGGVGVMDILGGTVAPSNYFIIGRSANGIGVVNVASGGVLLNPINTAGISFGWDANANEYGVLNILSGGLVNAGFAGRAIDLGATAVGNTGIMNLNSGGTALVYQITHSQVGTGILNLNGGLLIASNNANATLINSNLTAAYVYSGGVTISNNVNSTILEPLLAPTGYGVTDIALADGGTNYIGPPAVMISGGSGLGATAIAQINAAGVITNILITSYGSGYLPTDTLTVQLLGGGATAAGTLGTVTLGPNDGSGGVVKTGTGVLSFGGDNTYGGDTIISSGNVQIGSGGTSGSLVGRLVMPNTNNWLGFNRSDVITNYFNAQNLITANGNLAAIVQNGSGTLVLTNTTFQFNGAAVSNGLMLFASAATIPTNSTGLNSIILAHGGGVLVTNLYGSVNGWLNSGMLTNNPGGGLLALTAGVNTENINWVAGNGTVYSNLYLGVAPGNVATFLGTLTPVGTNYLVGGGGGTLVIGNANAFADPNMLTNRSVTFGNSGLASGVYVLGPQNYTGGTTINNALVSISADNNLGYGNITLLGEGDLQITNAPNFSTIKTITFNTSAGSNYLDVATGSTATLLGRVTGTSNSRSIQKLGGGTLILSNNVTLLNNIVYLKQGTTIVDSDATLTNGQYMDVAQVAGDNAALIVRGTGQIVATGDFNIGDVGGTGVMTVQDSANLLLNGTSGAAYIGKSGTGTLNQVGGTMSVANLIIGNATSGVGTNNLNGGVLTVRGTYITKVGGTGVFNFNGGTLRAGNNVTFSNLFTAATVNGNSFLDSSNYTVTLNQAFTGSGTLTKFGSGTVVVNSASNTFAAINANEGIIQFAATNGMTPGRTLLIGSGAAAGYTSGIMLDQKFLLRVNQNSAGTVALTANSANSLDFSAAGAGLTNVSLGAVGGTWTYSSVLVNFGNTYRLGGGGGTLVINNNIMPGKGTNLVAFGSGSGGTLILTGTNTWTSTTVNGGVVEYGSALSMGTNVTVVSGGAIANNGALDASLLARLNSASDGAYALVANNAAGSVNLSAFPSLSIGAANGSWTNDGAILPNGTTYRLGGGGGTLVITNSTLLAGAGTNLVAFDGSNSGNLVLTGTNTYDGGTLIGSLGTVTVATVSLGSGNVTNNGTLVFGVGSGTFTNTITGSGAMMQSAGTLVFAGANLSTGDTIIQQNSTLWLSNATGTAISGNLTLVRTAAGSIQVRTLAPNQLSSNSVLSLIQNSSAADIRFSMQGNDQVIGGLNGAILTTGNLIVEAAVDASTNMPATLTIVTPAGSAFSYAGSTAYMRSSAGGLNSALSLVKEGLGTQLLGGPQITYNGPTTINDGILVLSNTTAFASPLTINGGQLLLATPGDTTVKNQMVTNNAFNGLGFSGGNAFNIGGLAGSGSITLWSQTGGGVTLSVGGNNLSTTYSGTLTDVGPGNFYQGNLVKNGSGTLTLTGTNTYNGYNLINAGILQADVGVGLSPYANTTINGGSLASISGLITNAVGLGPNQFNILNGGFSAVGTPTTVALGGVGTPITLTWGTPGFSPATFTLNETNADNTLTLLNNLELNGMNAAVGANATNTSVLAIINGIISDSVGTGTLTKRGPGTLVFAAANTYSGATYLAGGNLAMTNDLLGVAGAPLYLTNNGALEVSGDFTLNNRAVTVQTGGGKFNVDNGVTFTVTNNITAAGGALTKVGGGTMVFTAGGTLNWLTNGVNVNGGTLLLTNNNLFLNKSAAYIGQNVGDVGTVILGQDSSWAAWTNNVLLYVGNAGKGTLIIQDNAFVGTNRLYVGNALGSAGAVYQRGGTSVWYNGTAMDGRIGMTGYGYYEMSGGSLTFQGYTQLGHDLTGVGVMAQLGGSVLQTNVLGGNLSLSRGGVGVYNMIDGVLTAPAGIDVGNSSDNGRSNGVAIFNMQGGAAVIAGNMSMANRSNMTLAAINLNGGVLTLNQITRSTTDKGSLALVNFNGGTLQARQSGIIIASGANAPDGTYIYAGGATINASNYVVTVPVNLLAPQGDGVTGIDLGAPSLSGYIGSPYVQISGGGGTGATAYAQFDSVAGLVTGIVMTSYGYGYTSDPTVMLIGNITNTLATLTRTPNTSGSLTVTGGSGALILSGTNTYGGGTILNGGTLLFASSNAMPAGTTTILVPYGSAFGVTNAASASYTNIGGWLASGIIDLNSSGTMALAYSTLATDPAIDLSGSGYPNMAIGAFGGLMVTNLAAIPAVNGAYRLGGGWGMLVLTNSNFLTGANWLDAFPAGTGGGLALYNTNDFSGGTLIGHGLGTVLVNSAYSLGTGPVTNNGALSFNNPSTITNAISMISGSGIVILANQVVNMLTSNSYSGGTWITSGNANAYLGDDNALGGGTIWITGNNPTLASTGFVTRTLANNFVLSNNVTYGTAANNGSLILNGNMDLGGGAPTQTVSVATVINGIIANGSLVKAGNSNLTLTAANTYAGTTSIRQGALTMGNAAALSSNTVFLGDGAANGGTLDLNNSYSLTIPALVTVVPNQNSGFGLTNKVINLAPGQSLNVVSSANSNVVNIGTGTHVIMSGGGTFNVNDPNGGLFIWGRSNNVTAYLGLDLSQLGNFSASVSNLMVGFDNASPQQASRLGLLTLATNNSITAASLTVGSATSDGGVKGQMFLGQSNTLNVANLYLGYGKAVGTMTYSNGYTNPQLTLVGTAGTDRANVYLGRFNQSGSGTAPTGYLMITNAGASITANLDQMILGDLQTNSSGAAAGGYGYFTFNGGTVDVNTAILGRSFSGATTGAGVGVLTINGGVLNVNTSFVLAQKLGGGSVTGTVNFAGGTAHIYTDLLGGGGVSTLTLNGGTLDMQGNNLGTSPGFISNLNFQAGTLQNVAEINGGAPLVKTTGGTLSVLGNNTYSGGTLISGGILQFGDGTANNGSVTGNITNNANLVFANPLTQSYSAVISGSGSLTKIGAGTLTLSGVNTYSGTTTVSNGTLLINGTQTSGGLISVFGGTLGGTGALGQVTVYAGGAYSPGNSPGTQLTGSLSLTGGLYNATLVTSTQYSQAIVSNLSIAAATTNPLQLSLANYTLEGGSQYVIIRNESAVPWSASGNGLFTLFDPAGPQNSLLLTNGSMFQVVGGAASTNLFRINYDFDVTSNTTGTGNDILLTVIPEPTTASLLLLLAAIGGLRRLTLRLRQRN